MTRIQDLPYPCLFCLRNDPESDLLLKISEEQVLIVRQEHLVYKRHHITNILKDKESKYGSNMLTDSSKNIIYGTVEAVEIW